MVDIVTSGEILSGEKRPLTLDLAQGIFIQSFRFSQGNDELQKLIFYYLHLLRPDWKVSGAFRIELEKAVRAPIKKILDVDYQTREKESGQHPSSHLFASPNEQKITDSVNGMLNIMKNTLDGFRYKFPANSLTRGFGGPAITASSIAGLYGDPIPLIAESMANMDFYYRKKGRKVDYLYNYAIQDRPTGLLEYDLMFDQIRSHLSQSRSAG